MSYRTSATFLWTRKPDNVNPEDTVVDLENLWRPHGTFVWLPYRIVWLWFSLGFLPFHTETMGMRKGKLCKRGSKTQQQHMNNMRRLSREKEKWIRVEDGGNVGQVTATSIAPEQTSITPTKSCQASERKFDLSFNIELSKDESGKEYLLMEKGELLKLLSRCAKCDCGGKMKPHVERLIRRCDHLVSSHKI